MLFPKIILRDFSKPLRERHPPHVGPYRWEPSTLPSTGRGFYLHSNYLACGDSTFDLRLDYAVSHCPSYFSYRKPRAFTGAGDSEYTPIIARLPHGHGYLAGWTMGHGMLSAIDRDIYQDIADAARAAYDMAERNAESDRDSEFQEEFEA